MYLHLRDLCEKLAQFGNVREVLLEADTAPFPIQFNAGRIAHEKSAQLRRRYDNVVYGHLACNFTNPQCFVLHDLKRLKRHLDNELFIGAPPNVEVWNDSLLIEHPGLKFTQMHHLYNPAKHRVWAGGKTKQVASFTLSPYVEGTMISVERARIEDLLAEHERKRLITIAEGAETVSVEALKNAPQDLRDEVIYSEQGQEFLLAEACRIARMHEHARTAKVRGDRWTDCIEFEFDTPNVGDLSVQLCDEGSLSPLGKGQMNPALRIGTYAKLGAIPAHGRGRWVLTADVLRILDIAAGSDVDCVYDVKGYVTMRITTGYGVYNFVLRGLMK